MLASSDSYRVGSGAWVAETLSLTSVEGSCCGEEGAGGTTSETFVSATGGADAVDEIGKIHFFWRRRHSRQRFSRLSVAVRHSQPWEIQQEQAVFPS